MVLHIPEYQDAKHSNIVQIYQQNNSMQMLNWERVREWDGKEGGEKHEGTYRKGLVTLEIA